MSKPYRATPSLTTSCTDPDKEITMLATDDYLRLFDNTMQRDRGQGFEKPHDASVQEATAYAIAALAAAFGTLAKKETEVR